MRNLLTNDELTEARDLLQSAIKHAGYVSECEIKADAVWITDRLNVEVEIHLPLPAPVSSVTFTYRGTITQNHWLNLRDKLIPLVSLPFNSDEQKTKAVRYAMKQWQQGRIDAWQPTVEQTRLTTLTKESKQP